MSFPQFTTTTKLADNTITTLSSVIRTINSLLTNLQQIFASLLKKVQLDSTILQQVQLKEGNNIIPHTLGRALSGWQVIRLRSAATIYDTQDSNPNPTVNLTLVASAACVVDLLVF